MSQTRRPVRPWTRAQVADYLSCSEKQVARDTKSGILEGVRVGNRWYYDPKKVMSAVGIEEPYEWGTSLGDERCAR